MNIEGTPRSGTNINRAGVTNEGELLVRSVSIPEESHAVNEGSGFGAYTGVINLNSDARTAVMYIRTDEEQPIIISGVTVGTGPSTGGADNTLLIEQVGNILPTDDIVANGTEVLVLNRNSGSAETFAGMVKKGPNTDFQAAVAGQGVLGDFTSSVSFDLLTELSRGSEIGLVLQAATGNTSMDVTISISFFRVEE